MPTSNSLSCNSQSNQITDHRQIYNQEVILPLADDFFEAQLKGVLQPLLKQERPIIFVGNHSGGSLSWDNIVFQALLDRIESTRPGGE